MMHRDVSGEPAEPELDPSYVAGLLDSIARVRFDLAEQDDGTFTVRPMLRIKPYETEMREAVVGNFLDSRGYHYDLVDRSRGHGFFVLQQRSDLEDLQEYLGGRSAHLVRELAFTTGPFADEFDFEILDPVESYRFLRTRDALRHGWRPRGRHHVLASEIADRYAVDVDSVSVPSLPDGDLRSDYSIEWIAGIFDGVGRYRPAIHRSGEHAVGYAMYPIARLHRTGVHPSYVRHVVRFCEDYNLAFADYSGEHDLGITFSGPSSIRRVLDVLFPRLLVLSQHSAVLLEEIFPRFDAGEHHTRQGFFRLLCDFDPIAQNSGGPYRGREFDPAFFADAWRDVLDPNLDREEAPPGIGPDEPAEPDEPDSEPPAPEGVDSVTLTPSDHEVDPGRYRTLVDRVRRDPGLAGQLQSRHGDRCQLCGDRLARGDGTGYSEVHHLQPLGPPHDGPDEPGNVLVLCPNHHADFDHGVVAIDPETLTVDHPYDSRVDGQRITTTGGHDLDPERIRYHNEVLSALDGTERQEPPLHQD